MRKHLLKEDKWNFSPPICLISHSDIINVTSVNDFIQRQRLLWRMQWICLIGTSKTNIFQHLRTSVREKQQDCAKVLLQCLYLISTHTPDSSWWPWEFTTWRKWFTSPKPPSFNTVGTQSRSGGDARLPKCVFTILPPPFLPFLLLLRVGHLLIYSYHKAWYQLRRVWDCLKAYFKREIKHAAKWFLLLRAITFGGAPFHGLGGDDFTRPSKWSIYIFNFKCEKIILTWGGKL